MQLPSATTIGVAIAATGVAILDQALQLGSLEALAEALQLGSLEALAEALAELDHALQSPSPEAAAEVAVLVTVFETRIVLESVVVMTAGVLSEDQADQVLTGSLAWTDTVIHSVLVEVMVSVTQALHV